MGRKYLGGTNGKEGLFHKVCYADSSHPWCSPLSGTGMGETIMKGGLSPAFRQKGRRQRVLPASAVSQLP